MKRIALSLLLLILFVAAANNYLNSFAPFSGSLWKDEIEMNNPYGRVEIYYDEFGVPHIYAENEKALFFAVGYLQAKDRLFQMDLHRRYMKGQLSEIFGEITLESDKFHVEMDFESAAKASWEVLKRNKSVREAILAYCEGVNAYINSGNLPIEFVLLNYKPEKWTPVDTLLIAKEIAWELTGNFWDLKREEIRRKLPEALELYPVKLGHGYEILENYSSPAKLENVSVSYPEGVGSNNWVISGKFTESGKPILANDPHLLLTAPPVWYEMHLKTKDFEVRGVTFPGIPFVIIGYNKHVAWGFTNVGADVIDFYAYVWKDGKYLYKGEWLEPKKEKRVIKVKGKEVEVEVIKTVHGPFLKKYNVSVAWTGFSGTREALAIYLYNKARSVEDVINAARFFDVPAQNLVVADESSIAYYPAGKYPIRYVDGKEVAGNVVFNGSKGDGEWIGFTPYGESSWEGFIPFEEIPHAMNPDYIATANQRIVGNYSYYLGDSMYFADPYRAMRIEELIEKGIKQGRIDVEYVKKMQRDVYSKPAEFFVPLIIEATKDEEMFRDYVEILKKWNYEMKKDSKAALIFSLWLKNYVKEIFDDDFEKAGIEPYYPRLWVIQKLEEDSKWFDDVRTEKIEKRRDIILRALEKAVEEMNKNGWKTYGDYNRLKIEHPFGVKLKVFNYPSYPMNGSKYTIYNFRVEENPQVGSSFRMIVEIGEKAYTIIPGGNSGRITSKHYFDQLEMWINCDYKEVSW